MIKNILVIGAGVMGSDIAFEMAINSYKVILMDKNEEALKLAKDRIYSNFKLVKLLNIKKRVDDIDVIFSNIHFTSTHNKDLDVDLIIENVTESIDVKKEVYREIQEFYNKEEVIFAINTSCISITKIASFFFNPRQVIGMHFMNPVALKELVEIIIGFHTSKECENIVLDFLKSINKEGVIVKDMPGFVANRISHLYMNEAVFILQEGTASAEQIDTIFKKGYGHKMGPLETADLIGLDTVYNSMIVLYEGLKDSKYRPCPLLEKMVNAGLLGRKVGQGFYKYNI